MRQVILISILLTARFGLAQLVPYGATWKYYDLAMSPPNQGSTTWIQNAFNDASWASGPSELGYGDGDEATVISSSTLTAYYRYTFNVDDPADYSNLNLQLTYDDGSVIYLNGVEIWRVNMPSGPITYNTFASSTSSDNAQATTTVANTLVAGTNLLAVENHQRSANSSDLSFNITMSGVPANGVAIVTRGPYLQKANSSSIVIRWRTNIATASIVDYGPSPTSLTQTTTDTASTVEHVLSLTSLSASTVYYYQIRTNSDTLVFPSNQVYFKTYPVPGTATPLTAWILGDCGTGNNDARNVRNA
ncbi:MAG TPA: fibronectin type III domain-containing protein, partial [Saprospiraceae bacterium]|nr:fibronectin type III domain-containing protein [Saprospiraceae bacterium]